MNSVIRYRKIKNENFDMKISNLLDEFDAWTVRLDRLLFLEKGIRIEDDKRLDASVRGILLSLRNMIGND